MALGVALAAAGAPKPADAETPTPAPRYTVYVDRGMSLPRPYLFGTLGWSAIVRSGQPVTIEGSLGGGVGVTSWLWIDGSVGTLRLAPGLVFHSAQIGPNVLLLDTPRFELTATAHVSFPSDDGRPVEQVEPGLYGVLRFSPALRVDPGLYLDVNPGPKTTVGLRLPVNLGFQLGEHVHGVVNAGVTTTSFADAAGTTALPLGVTLGWSDRIGRGPVSVGLLPSISFPELVKPWAKESFRPGYVVLGITFVVVTKY